VIDLKICLGRRVKNWCGTSSRRRAQLSKAIQTLRRTPRKGGKIGTTPLRKLRLNRKYRLIYLVAEDAVYLLDVVPSDVATNKKYTSRMCRVFAKLL